MIIIIIVVVVVVAIRNKVKIDSKKPTLAVPSRINEQGRSTKEMSSIRDPKIIEDLPLSIRTPTGFGWFWHPQIVRNTQTLNMLNISFCCFYIHCIHHDLL
jgi:hypothetical protein